MSMDKNEPAGIADNLEERAAILKSLGCPTTVSVMTQAARVIRAQTEALERIADEHTERDWIECQSIAREALEPRT